MKTITKKVDTLLYKRVPEFKNRIHNEMINELFDDNEDHSKDVIIDFIEESKQFTAVTVTVKKPKKTKKVIVKDSSIDELK